MQEREYDNPLKVWVGVITEISAEGEVMPLEIIWENGKRYAIDEVDGQPTREAATKAGGIGMRYRIRIGDKWRYLWDEEGRWFVERRMRP